MISVEPYTCMCVREDKRHQRDDVFSDEQDIENETQMAVSGAGCCWGVVPPPLCNGRGNTAVFSAVNM